MGTVLSMCELVPVLLFCLPLATCLPHETQVSSVLAGALLFSAVLAR